MANINLSTIKDRLATMKRADNQWADTYVRDVGHLLKLLDAAVARERERAAGIAEVVKERATRRYNDDSDNGNVNRLGGEIDAASEIAAAIREQD